MIYFTEYKVTNMNINEARKLAEDEMKLHGLYDWTFEFDKASRRFGACHYNLKRITLSKVLVELNNPLVVLDTIRHEIAHALVGSGHGHNIVWKRKAIQIGCDGSRTYDSTKVVTPKKKYVGTCPNCRREVERLNRVAIACGSCCKKYNNNMYSVDYLFKWKENK